MLNQERQICPESERKTWYIRLFQVPKTHRLLRSAAICSLLLSLLTFPVLQAPAADPPLLDDSPLAHIQGGEYEKALEQLQKAFSLYPYNQEVRKALTAAYAAVGKRQLERKEFDEAAANFGHAAELAPENQEYAILRGIALYLGKHYDQAAIELEQASQGGGTSALPLFYLGRVYYDTGDLAKALEAWDRALLLEPENKTILEAAAKARREAAVESRMNKGYSPMFSISHDEGTRPDLADAVLDVLETAYNRVGSDLAYYPVTRVPVILYTKKDYRLVTAGPEWSGGLYDGKVRLPIGGARELTPVLRGVLFHEYTHVVVGELAKGNCPTWLNEGLAEVEGRKEYDHAHADLGKAVKTGALLQFTSLEKSLSGLNAQEAALAYEQSYVMVRFMIASYGWHKVRDILVNLGTGMRIEPAIAKAFADYGLDYPSIVQEWQAYMRKEYGER